MSNIDTTAASVTSVCGISRDVAMLKLRCSSRDIYAAAARKVGAAVIVSDVAISNGGA